MRKTGRLRAASQGTRGTKVIAVLSILATTSAVLYGCSSGGSEHDKRTDPEGAETSSSTSGSDSGSHSGTAPGSGSQGSGEPGGAESGAGEAPNPEGGGGFESAGRLSGYFPGVWPAAQVLVSNSSTTTTFVGTVTLADCTDAQHQQRADPPQQTITVLPKATATAQFSFKSDSDDIAHTVCAQLTDAQGHRQTASNVLGKTPSDGASPSAPQKAPGTSSDPHAPPPPGHATSNPKTSGPATSSPKTSGPATSNPKGPTSPAP
ncbi:hypothetical protein ACFZBU_45075 [Embleya sp. NPDC008237]|uniref:hypothetical protein n=1 Tax=Embleya sp. NPDC008237 TaxID=3363978 RepID=UPI0036E33C55